MYGCLFRKENSSPQILFYPRECHVSVISILFTLICSCLTNVICVFTDPFRGIQVHVTTDQKQPKIPEFQGRPGICVKGSVIPALEGVQITVVAENDSPAGGVKAGEMAISTVTGSDGTYVAGPLYDDTTYFSQASLVFTDLAMLYNRLMFIFLLDSLKSIRNIRTNIKD